MFRKILVFVLVLSFTIDPVFGQDYVDVSNETSISENNDVRSPEKKDIFSDISLPLPYFIFGLIAIMVTALINLYQGLKKSFLEHEKYFEETAKEILYHDYTEEWMKIWNEIKKDDTKLDYYWNTYLSKKIFPREKEIFNEAKNKLKDRYKKKILLGRINDKELTIRLDELNRTQKLIYFRRVERELPILANRAVTSCYKKEYITTNNYSDWKKESMNNLKMLMIFNRSYEYKEVLEITIDSEINKFINNKQKEESEQNFKDGYEN